MEKGNIEELVDGYIEIFKSVIESNKESLLKKYFKINNCDKDRYKYIFSYLAQKKDGLKYVSYFKNTNLQTKLTQELKQEISQGNFLMSDYFVLKVLHKLDTNLEDIFNSIIVRLNKFQTESTEELDQLFLAFLFFYENKIYNIEEIMKSFVSSGRIFYYLQVASSSNCYVTVAICVIIKLLYYKLAIEINLPKPSHNENATNGRNTFENIFNFDFYKNKGFQVELIEILDNTSGIYDVLFKSFSDPSENLIEVKIFKDIIKQNFVKDKVNTIGKFSSFLLSHNYFIRESLKGNEDIFNEYVEKSLEIETLDKLIDNIEYDCRDENHCSFAERVLSLNLDSEKFAEWIHKTLSTLDNETWREYIGWNGHEPIIVERLSSKHKKKFGNPLRETLEEIGNEITNENEAEFEIDQILTYIDVLDKDSLIVFKQNMRDRLFDNADSNFSLFIKYFDKVLKDCKILKEKIDDFFRKFLMKKIESPNVDELNWCTEAIVECRLNDRRFRNVKSIIKVIKGKIDEIIKDTELEPEVKKALEDLKNVL